MSSNKICVISDTHGNRKAIKKIILDNLNIKTIIHLGDNENDVDFLYKFDDLNVFSIKGNCDYNSSKKSEDIIDFLGKKIFITHGHEYNVKYGYQNLYYRACELNVDIVLFGHTHKVAEFSENGILFFNPGSIYRPKSSYGKTYGILEVGENSKFKIVNFE